MPNPRIHGHLSIIAVAVLVGCTSATAVAPDATEASSDVSSSDSASTDDTISDDVAPQDVAPVPREDVEAVEVSPPDEGVVPDDVPEPLDVAEPDAMVDPGDLVEPDEVSGDAPVPDDVAPSDVNAADVADLPDTTNACNWPCDPQFPGASGCIDSPDVGMDCIAHECIDGCCHVAAKADGTPCASTCYSNLHSCTGGECVFEANWGEDQNPCTETSCNSCGEPCTNHPVAGLPCGDGEVCNAVGECGSESSVCADGSTELYLSPTIRGCVASWTSLDPAVADATCAAGWHVCSAQEYCSAYTSISQFPPGADFAVAGSTMNEGKSCDAFGPTTALVHAASAPAGAVNVTHCGCALAASATLPGGVLCCEDP